MPTHRSLNKLEFKAHMSIHNFTEVSEAETHEARNSTRDRFGKSHALSNEDGSSRVTVRKRNLKILVMSALLGSFFQASAFTEEAPVSRRNTDVQVGSESIDTNEWLDQKLNKPEDKFGIPIDRNTSLGFNDDGDPNVGMRF